MDESRHNANAQHLKSVHLLPAAPLHEGVPALRVYLRSGFTITLGERSLDASAWRLRKAQSLVKLLVLAPSHRLHRERVLDSFGTDLRRYEAAINHYGGNLLPDDRYEDWAANRREALDANYQALVRSCGSSCRGAHAIAEAAGLEPPSHPNHMRPVRTPPPRADSGGTAHPGDAGGAW